MKVGGTLSYTQYELDNTVKKNFIFVVVVVVYALARRSFMY